MLVDVKVPAVGESIQEGMIHKWHKHDGEYVERDQVLLELETDKATVEIVAEQSGTVKTLKKEGETVAIGEVIGSIDTSAAKSSAPAKPATTAAPAAPVAAKPAAPQQIPTPKPTTAAISAPPAPSQHPLSPAVKRMVEEHQVDPTQVAASGRDGRLTKGDVITHLESTPAPARAVSPVQHASVSTSRTERREPMSMLRRRIAERLVYAQHTAAMLTTFNEVDMSAVMSLRAKYKDTFKEKYGFSLGFMGLFVKAAVAGLQSFPRVNGWIDGNDIVYHDYIDIGVAVSTERGLIVPVVRDADHLSIAQVEEKIGEYAKKARDNKISVDELTGGTFTVSNGGVFGSLLSTPILNPPQSAILGMHKIEERPIALNGQVVIRPMMYLALSYDHRIVDGREAVQFLVKIKECIEDPQRLLIGV